MKRTLDYQDKETITEDQLEVMREFLHDDYKCTYQEKDTITKDQLEYLKAYYLDEDDCAEMYEIAAKIENLRLDGFWDNYRKDYQSHVQSVADWLYEFPCFIITPDEVMKKQGHI